ncbi:MAG: helicase C-terminal domain-containing protein [Candidatus Dormibacteria bacterium]
MGALPLEFGPGTEYVAFDLETTGLSPRSDRIFEVGAVRFTADGTSAQLTSLADPGIPLPLAIQRLCGLSDHDLAGQPSPAEVVAQLADFARGAVLVGHGVSFDLAFCSAVLPAEFAQRPAVDTSELARILLPRAPSHSLEQLGRALGLVHDRPHRALSDADTTRLLLWRLVEEMRKLTPGLRARLAAMSAGSGWATGEFMASQLQPVEPGKYDRLTVRPPSPAATSGPHPGGRLDPAEVAADFAEGGVLAAADPSFELREEQQQMAVAVTQAFNREMRLLVEAGTGVGKSLAYLHPAREWAHRTGDRVLISTHTITLQEQLLGKDLPALEAARPLPVRAVVLKGRGNYVSLRRLERWLSSAAPGARRRDLDELRFQLRLVVWAEQTETGDRGELRLAGRDPELWEQVGSTVDDCLGPACHNWRDRRCFMARARLEAREADLVIVNHALLLADADSGGSILPESRRLVVDEAHHLEEAATQAQSDRLGPGRVAAVVDRLPRFGDAPLAGWLRSAREGAQNAFAELRHLLEQRADGGDRGALVLDPRLAGDPAWARCARALGRAQSAAQRAAVGLRQAAVAAPLQEMLWPQPDNAARECLLAADSLQSCADFLAFTLAAVAGESAASQRVVWAELEARGRAVLRSAPYEIGATLAEQLFSRMDTVVLTSATLAVAGSFRYVRDRLGFDGGEELVLASPFDFLSQALLCIPRGIPPHDDPRHAEVVARLVDEVATDLGGRTLVLFTGYASLREVASRLRPRLQGRGIALLAQGLDGTRNQLLRGFRDHPRTVLMGTSSFWEGIDLPGDLLQCVVIDKLPFPVPSDPIFQARARGRPDSFTQLSLPEAVLRLKQGFGRLVRGRDDRGAVVVCDPRIHQRRYGQSFVEALPRATISDQPVEAVGSLVGEFVRARRGPRPIP